MGRSRRVNYGGYILPRDKGTPGKTIQSLREFYYKSMGGISYQLDEQNLLTYDAQGEMVVDAPAVTQAAERFEREVVSTREEPRERFLTQAQESTGLNKRATENVVNREAAARAGAIIAAADAGKVKLTPYQRRLLNPISQGKYMDVVYGERGQFEQGTLLTRIRNTYGKAKVYRTPEARARAQQLADEFREYRMERALRSA